MHDDDLDYSTDWTKWRRRVHRQLMDEGHGIAVLVLLEIEVRAEYERRDRRVTSPQGGTVTLPPGTSLIGTESDLGERIRLKQRQPVGRQAIRTALGVLKRLGVITYESTKLGTVVTLARYSETYAPGEHEQPSKQPSRRRGGCIGPADPRSDHGVGMYEGDQLNALLERSTDHQPSTHRASTTTKNADSVHESDFFGSRSEADPSPQPTGDRDREEHADGPRLGPIARGIEGSEAPTSELDAWRSDRARADAERLAKHYRRGGGR